MAHEIRQKRIVVIGAGAAGLMAAAAASESGSRVTVLEKNEKAGKKIYITGKGRCNLTNACDTADFFEHVVRNPKFLYSALPERGIKRLLFRGGSDKHQKYMTKMGFEKTETGTYVKELLKGVRE